MEKKLIKAATYGFILGLFIAVLYYPDVKVYHESNGASFVQVPLREYIFQVLRFAIRASLAAVAAVGLVELFKLQRSTSAEFIKGIIISFVSTFLLIMLIVWILKKVLV
jgi:hypothetical protein